MSGAESLKAFSASLRKLPTVVAQKVAAAAAPELTAVALSTFNAGENAYGTAWAPREDGSSATLRDSGSLASKIHYVAIGTKLRVALSVPYAKYVVGKRPVFPTQGGVLPTAYRETLERVTADVCRAELGR